jgi:hypothetical protein
MADIELFLQAQMAFQENRLEDAKKLMKQLAEAGDTFGAFNYAELVFREENWESSAVYFLMVCRHFDSFEQYNVELIVLSVPSASKMPNPIPTKLPASLSEQLPCDWASSFTVLMPSLLITNFSKTLSAHLKLW